MELRVSVNLNRIKVPYLEDFEKAALYHKSKGVNITWVFRNTDLKGYTSVYHPEVKRYLITGAENLIIKDSSCDIDMFVFDEGEWIYNGNPLETPSGLCKLVNYKPYITIPTLQYDHDTNIQWVVIAHEITHALVYMANLKGIPVKDVMDTYRDNANPYSPFGNFYEQFKLLQPFLTMNQYKYFKPSEIVGLQDSLVKVLDTARGMSGVPYKITSGYRTAAQNKAVGGVNNSAHLTGLAVDIAISSNSARTAILRGLLTCGTPLFIEIANKHIHVDLSSTTHTLGDTIVISTDD